MKAVLKYPGAKNRLADWIVGYIPKHDVYLEPFFGSGAVLFNKPRSYLETVNDIDGEVVNFFKVLRDNHKELQRLIELTPWSREEYYKSFELSGSGVERARRFCVRCWMGIGNSNNHRNGFKVSKQKVSPNPAGSWASLSETIEFVSERLKGVQIESMEAVELIGRYNTSDVFIYADPPYLLDTRKGYLYKREMANHEHEELLEVLLNHPGKVMISGYDSEMYNVYLKDWRWESIKTLAEGATSRTEKIWMNYPPAGQASIFDFIKE